MDDMTTILAPFVWLLCFCPLGLTYVPHRIGCPHLEGTIDGRRVRVSASRGRIGSLEGGSGSRPAVTGYNVYHSHEEIGWISFKRRKKTSVTFRQETPIDDPQFDEEFAVYTSHLDIAQAIVSDPDLKQRILSLQDTMISISKSTVSVVDYGVEKDLDIMRERVRLAIDIAKRVDAS